MSVFCKCWFEFQPARNAANHFLAKNSTKAFHHILSLLLNLHGAFYRAIASCLLFFYVSL